MTDPYSAKCKSGCRRITSGFLVTAIALLAGCEKTPWLPPAGFVGDPVEGKALFSTRCVACHGLDAKGTPQGPPLVHEIYRPQHHADVAFHLAVKNGVGAHHWHFGNMPPQPGFTPEQVGHMAAWIRREQRRAGIE